ncbi:MAG: hypothetical protein J3K34DRAFT_433420 [Monoraphidium minutum]|nr:MAG: hypothetical protein J3K34DRAFT_433420 [Monoraphidium minutum]
MAVLQARTGLCGRRVSAFSCRAAPLRPAACRGSGAPRVAVAAPPAALRAARQSAAPAAAEQQQQQQPRQQQQHEQQHQRPAAAASAASLAAAAALLAVGPAAAGGLPGLDAGVAHTIETILRPLFALFTMLYIIRIPMTWYPSIDGTQLPWLVAYGPTEPILKVTRKVIPLVGGVDVTPIVWVGVLSFLSEILLGPQGILMLVQRQSGAGL